MTQQLERRKLLLIATVLFLLIGLALAWRWGPLAEYLDIDTVSIWLDSLRNHRLAPYIIVSGYVIASLVMFPITILILATAYVFGPLAGFLYAFLGSLLGAIGTYALGYFMGPQTLGRVAGSRIESVCRHLNKHGFVTMMTTHLVPVAPFTIVNMAAGAARIRFHDFVFGTALGLLPGIVAITVFEQQLENALRNPGMGSFLILGGFLLLILTAVLWTRRRMASDSVANH